MIKIEKNKNFIFEYKFENLEILTVLKIAINLFHCVTSVHEKNCTFNGEFDLNNLLYEV